MGDARLLSLKKELGKALDNHRPETVNDVLAQLRKVTATKALLKSSGIGVAVTNARKHKDITDEQRAICKDLITKWKQDIAVGESKPVRATSNNTNEKVPQPRVDTSDPPTRRTSASGSTPTPGTPLSSGPARSIDSDKLKMNSTGETLRDKCIGLLYAALVSDTDMEGTSILRKAEELERLTYELYPLDMTPAPPGKKTDPALVYKNRIKSLTFNLKDRDNPDLCLNVLSGKISIEKLANMTTEQMASKERKEAIQTAKNEALSEAISAQDTQAETDMFQCGKCKQRRTKYFQMQTRSADEPMTTFVTCLNCGHRWKFC
ncbi:transcription elongation factor S-II [Fimicolochytrium jonesii]|uniref:transcription elongation factor S-II n=1 Tax=Fimicolochytrium jonesii TaxID=1396493 RepID=UPI0022FE68B5|nr:transcription elongation factor S-II [Fimicolochytrium jonesii]KAI8816500.1 transcription elongation factor S-II [Fimicolochytrium jonesii]